MDGHDSRGAGLVGEVGGLGEARHDVLEACVAQAGVAAGGCGGGADCHAEALWGVSEGWMGVGGGGKGAYGLEAGDLLVSVGVEVGLEVVNGHSTCESAEQGVRVLLDSLVGSVASAEVHDGRPVVG